VTNLPAWTPFEPYKPRARIKAFGHDVIVDPVIDGRHLAKRAVRCVAGLAPAPPDPEGALHPELVDCRRQGVYETEIRLKNLIKMAKARHRF
jgi:hypothetical protein